MINNIVISIDWDHTFRNMSGIDLNLLALSLYAKSKDIPVGITTHRDIENTALYTLYHWQYEKPEDTHDALAAAISYWDTHLFKPLNLSFDFINARYQPLHLNNYYQTVLYPLEKNLAQEISVNHLLDYPSRVQEKIHAFEQTEDLLENNEYKEAQILWLGKQYPNKVIFHIDDSNDVCQHLQQKSRILSEHAPKIHTIFYAHSPLFANEACIPLLVQIGLMQDIQMLIHWPAHDDLLKNHLRCLSICLALLQWDVDDAVLATITALLDKMTGSLQTELQALHQLIRKLCIATQSNAQTYSIMPNHLKLFADT